MHTNTPHPAPGGADSEELDDHVEEMDDRGLATEAPRPALPHAGTLGKALSYPPLCAHGMNSFVDRGYDLALARQRRG